MYKRQDYPPENLIGEILFPQGLRNLRKAQAILRLGEKYGADLERACARALSFGNYRYKSLKAILEKGLFQPELPVSATAPIPLSSLGQSFLRPPGYFGPRVEA